MTDKAVSYPAKTTAADGKTEVHHLPGVGLVVSAVDFNALYAAREQDRARAAAPQADLVTVGAMHQCRTDDKFDRCVHCGAMAEQLARPCKNWMAEAEAAMAEAAAPQAAVGLSDEQIEAIALARYKVVPAHGSMFWSHAVVAGDGTQHLYTGREVECQNMAAKFTGAFLDGAFLALSPATKPEAPAADCDVTTIMLSITPGEDGMGHEVYAKSVADVEAVLSRMGQELEEWQLGIRRLEAATTQAQEAAVGPMAKMAQALREKAAAERSDFDRRVQSGEWGPMPGPETEADDLPDHVAEIEGDDAVRELRWNKRIGAFNYPVGTKLYAAPTQPQPEHEPQVAVGVSDAESLYEFKVRLTEYGLAMRNGNGEKARVLAEVLASMLSTATKPEAPALFRALLTAEREASIDVSGDIARQEAQIDLADHLLVKFNELFPEASNVRT